MDVSIVGGGGHVGLPFGLVLADTGFDVTLVDTDEERLATIEDGQLPFNEPGGEPLLRDVLETGRLSTSTDVASVAESDVIVVVIGTPIDEHHNPQMDPLLSLVDDLVDHATEGQLMLFRSTVYPGTTSIVCDRLERAGYAVGDDVYVSFAPERVAQHNALEEIVGLPQLIGAPDDESYQRTAQLFDAFLEEECLRLTPTEAELGKLYTNMWRYITFAAANEFYLIAESFAKHHDVNVHRVLDRTAHEYPRFDVPSPGANVGGPCLTKDGWFLVDNIPFNELVSASYQINEGMPSQIVQRLAEKAPDPEKVAILGMTFKAESDDTRNSVAFKLEKQLQMKGYSNVLRVEPNVDGFDDLDAIRGSDWVILMTPHEEFGDFAAVREHVANEECCYCDIWGHWEDVKYGSDNGYFFGDEIQEITDTPRVENAR